MTTRIDCAALTQDLRALGLRRGDTVMMHSSFRALGIGDPELILQALFGALGDAGTLLMPALSYRQPPPTVHNTLTTPACVGFLPEYFRTRPGTRRSLHPTHSVCGVGARAHELLADHFGDVTPCGEHSPFHKLLHCGGKILMLGCGLRPNTTMHAIEEYARPPYLFGAPLTYTIIDAAGRLLTKEYIPHNFRGFAQRYDRVAAILCPAQLRAGTVGQARAYLIDAAALLPAALACLRREPYYFVDQEMPA
jgi:aminoglycoside 3-N-acetyltransferase